MHILILQFLGLFDTRYVFINRYMIYTEFVVDPFLVCGCTLIYNNFSTRYVYFQILCLVFIYFVVYVLYVYQFCILYNRHTTDKLEFKQSYDFTYYAHLICLTTCVWKSKNIILQYYTEFYFQVQTIHILI